MQQWLRPALAVLAGLLLTSPLAAAQVSVQSSQITQFAGRDIGDAVGGLIWRGGISMASQDDLFGGISGVTFTSQDQHMAFVTDRGQFISGRLAYDTDGRALGLVGVEIDAVQNSKGAPLPRQFSRDAEALDVVIRDGEPIAVRVGYENLTRLADFALTDHRPGGAAREIAIPPWLTEARSNGSLESVCIAPPASPVAGSTLLLTEAVYDEAGNHRAYLVGVRDRGDLTYRAHPSLNPTDCAFLPNGDLLVLERGVAFITFTMRVRHIPADAVRAGNLMEGEVLLEASGGDIDNMEGIAVHTAPDGETRIVITSDDNFNDWQRSLLLEFALPE